MGNDDKNVIIQKNGNGLLYYRIALNYSPSNLHLNPVNYGFKVERTYESIDDLSDVQEQSDGTWKFKLSENIKVTVTMTTAQRRYHIALVDYLPAGCESLNRNLDGNSNIYKKVSNQTKKQRSNKLYRHPVTGWADHENLRDERAEAFRSVLSPGVYEWTYIMRATCAGKFIVPPARAEEMYSPEIFGRSATTTVIIE